MTSTFLGSVVTALVLGALSAMPNPAMALQDFGKDEVLTAWRFDFADAATAARCAAGGGKVATGWDGEPARQHKFCIGGKAAPPQGASVVYETVPFSEAPYAFATAFHAACGARGGLVATEVAGRSFCLRPKKPSPGPAQHR